jgi:hypothetical protein
MNIISLIKNPVSVTRALKNHFCFSDYRPQVDSIQNRQARESDLAIFPYFLKNALGVVCIVTNIVA